VEQVIAFLALPKDENCSKSRGEGQKACLDNPSLESG
jgi:hypothetical protein